MGFILLLLIGFIFLYETLVWGLVLYKFWGWFVLPIFTTLPEINFVQALGLMFVVGLFKSNYIGENIHDDYKKKFGSSFITTYVMPWLTLFFGWLAYVIWLV